MDEELNCLPACSYTSVLTDEACDALSGFNNTKDVLEVMKSMSDKLCVLYNKDQHSAKTISLSLYDTLDLFMHQACKNWLPKLDAEQYHLFEDVFIPHAELPSHVFVTEVKLLLNLIRRNESVDIQKTSAKLLRKFLLKFSLTKFLHGLYNFKDKTKAGICWVNYLLMIVSVPSRILGRAIEKEEEDFFKTDAFYPFLAREILDILDSISTDKVSKQNLVEDEGVDFTIPIVGQLRLVTQLVEKMVVLGISNLLIDEWIPAIKRPGIKHLRSVLLRMNPSQIDRFFSVLIVRVGQNVQFPSLELKKNLLLSFVDKISLRIGGKLYYLFSNKLVTQTMLSTNNLRLLISCSIDAGEISTIENIVNTWTDNLFIRNAPTSLLIYVTTALIICLGLVPKGVIKSGTKIFNDFISGAPAWLDIPNEKIRIPAMVAFETFVKLSDSKVPVNFDFGEEVESAECFRSLAMPSDTSVILQTKSFDKNGLDPLVVSSKDTKCCLDNPEQQVIHVPRSVHECIQNLKKDEPDNMELALKFFPRVILDSQGEIKDVSINACSALLRLDDSYFKDDFEDRLLCSIAALALRDPDKVISYLVEQFFDGEYSFKKKYIMLGSIHLLISSVFDIPTKQSMRLYNTQSEIYEEYNEMMRNYIMKKDVSVTTAQSHSINRTDAKGGNRSILEVLYMNSMLIIGKASKSTYISMQSKGTCNIYILIAIVNTLSSVLLASMKENFPGSALVAKEFFRFIFYFVGFKPNSGNEALFKSLVSGINILRSDYISVFDEMLAEPIHREMLNKWLDDIVSEHQDESLPSLAKKVMI